MLDLSRYLMRCGHKPSAETKDGKPCCLDCECEEMTALLPSGEAAKEAVCNHNNFQLMKDPDTEGFYVFCFDCLRCSGDHKNRLAAMNDFLFNWGN